MGTPLAKIEPFFFKSRYRNGSPMIFGPHALTWVQLFPGVWFLAQVEKITPSAGRAGFEEEAR